MKTANKHIRAMAVAVLLCLAWLGRAQEATANYIMTTTHLSADSTQAARRVVSYHDGLGRPVQMLRRHAATNADDLVDLTEYDSLGRVSRIWNPVSIWAVGNQVSAEMFTPAATSYYADECPFSETLYDGTPLDRIRKVTGPGEAWHNAGKGVKSNYLTNTVSTGTDSLHCVKYGFTLSGDTGIAFTCNGLWPAGSLTVDRTEDEDGRTLWVFKDMRELTVLERRLAEAATNSAGAVYADTYYLYDNAGRLTAVLPPEMSKRFSAGTWSGSTGDSPEVEGFAYQYRYDARGRMIAKKLPGAGWTYYVYDQGDRLVLTQDGNQRGRNEWSFRLQDLLGRECLTGVLAGNYNAFSNPLGSVQVRAVRDRSSGNYGDLHGYTVEGFSLPPGAEVLTVNWWDDYSFLGREAGMDGGVYGYTAPGTSEPYGAFYEASTSGLQTGHWSRTLGEVRDSSTIGPAVMESWYYDDHGRVVYHVKGYPSGRRIAERSGYDFVGNLTAVKRAMHDGTGTQEHTEEYAYTYDSWGRLQSTVHTLDGGSPVTLASNSYDSVGRLSGTERGNLPTLAGLSLLGSSYTYNVRGWLTGINSSLFSETLTYETPRSGSSLPGQWGGNISSSSWSIGDAAGDVSWYDYGYDLLSRLTIAKYGSGRAMQNDYTRRYSYDLNGNPKTRHAYDLSKLLFQEKTDRVWTWAVPDGNQAVGWTQNDCPEPVGPPVSPAPLSAGGSVTQGGASLRPDLNLVQESYGYDAAGNRTDILNGSGDTLSVMRYNLLNLPAEYVSADGDTVNYVYSADGEKLYVEENPSGGTVQGTEYAANYRIENGTVTMIYTDAGYYTPLLTPGGSTASSYTHIWYLKDHLGNNRVLADGSGNAVALHDYDPYGEEIAVASSSLPYPLPPGAKDSPYKYGGKEWNETTSTYDFEARYLSPSFHRFTTMDPLAEKYYSISPYAYCANNPCNYSDPFGFSYYMVNGVEHRLDDGDDSFRMVISENEFDRLVKYYANNRTRYVRYRNHLSRTHEYTTVETESSPSTDLPGSVITVHQSGESYLDYQSQSYQWIDILNVLDIILSQANNDYATERVYYGSNGQLYFRQPSGLHFHGNQYVKVVEFAEQFNAALKTLRISDKILEGINYASIARDVYSVFIYEGGFGINSQLILEAKLAGLLGAAIGGHVGAALGASSGFVTGPGAVLASLGLSIALGAAGGQVEKIADGTIFF